MRCMSCTADIPPEWVNAIQRNVCPGCGGEIMNEPAKELLTELTAAMERMPNNPQGVAGWLLSNYQLRKVGEAQPVEHFHTKQQMAQGGFDEHQLKIANNPVQQMLQRSGQFKNIQATQAKLAGAPMGGNRMQQLAEMAQGIAEVDNTEAYLTADENFSAQQYYDPDDDAIIERGPRMSKQLVAAGASLVDPSVQPPTPEELAELSGYVEEPVQDADLANRILQQQRIQRLRTQQDVANGGGNGVFRRRN